MKTEPILKKVCVRGAWVRSILLGVAILLPPFAIPLLPHVGEATSCTRGTTCYCDRVRGGNLNDPNLLLCEDFEAPTLHNDVGFGHGAPDYGPWYDDTGYTNARGFNSYWQRMYGSATGSCAWSGGQPASPMVGHTCGFQTCFQGDWRVDDLYQANSFACMNVIQNGEFALDVGTLTPPTGSVGGGSGVFDGNQSMGFRVGAGRGTGIVGTARWTPTQTFGVTMAAAYATNTNASGIWASPWKHHEWVTAYSPGPGLENYDGLFLFHNAGGRVSNDPFLHFIFYVIDNSSTCTTKLAAATKTTGVFSCASTALYYQADTSIYSQATDWPDGTWGCVQGYFQNMGTANSSIQIWFTGPAGVQKKVVDISGMDLTGTTAVSGYKGIVWNDYSNANSGVGGAVPTSQSTYRYEDNIHIRAGAPVSCAQIGFSAAGGPSAPSGLTVR